MKRIIHPSDESAHNCQESSDPTPCASGEEGERTSLWLEESIGDSPDRKNNASHPLSKGNVNELSFGTLLSGEIVPPSGGGICLAGRQGWGTVQCIIPHFNDLPPGRRTEGGLPESSKSPKFPFKNHHLQITPLFLLLFFPGLSTFLNLFTPLPQKTEICDNARDDDQDGLIDLNDPDCACRPATPVSLIPNFSFEERSCCPVDWAQMGCVDDWVAASLGSTDYVNLCGWGGNADFPLPLPIPDGDGCVGFRNGRFTEVDRPNYKEYAGACLNLPLQAGETYRFNFHVGFTEEPHSPPFRLALYGTTSCDNLPFGKDDPNPTCPSAYPGWVELGGINVRGVETWVLSGIRFQAPADIYAIAIGADCDVQEATEDLYYYFDNLVLDEDAAFDFVLSSEGHPCDQLTLRVPEVAGSFYQWYLDGVALPGATSSEFIVPEDEGLYQVRIIDEEGDCRLSDPYQKRIPSFESAFVDSFCVGEPYTFGAQELNQPGTYTEVFISQEGCDSTVTLNLKPAAIIRSKLVAKIFPGTPYELAGQRFERPGSYQLKVPTTQGCDQTVEIELKAFQYYLPNAFSPNEDNINDEWKLFAEADITEVRHLQLFDRWGGMVHERRSIPVTEVADLWAGKSGQKEVPAGIYLYRLELAARDGQVGQINGMIQVLR